MEETDAWVAQVTQQCPHLSRPVAMVNVWAAERVSAAGTDPLLLSDELVPALNRESVGTENGVMTNAGTLNLQDVRASVHPTNPNLAPGLGKYRVTDVAVLVPALIVLPAPSPSQHASLALIHSATHT